jgi:hypothetical protein
MEGIVSRPSTFFAMATILLLVFGMLASRFIQTLGLSVTWHRTGYIFPAETFCNGVALVFCCFTFLYSVWVIPWNNKAAMWHFGLSLSTLAIFAAGYMAIQYSLRPAAFGSDHLPLHQHLTIAGFIVGQVLFVFVQAWFVLDFLRRLWLVSVRN